MILYPVYDCDVHTPFLPTLGSGVFLCFDKVSFLDFANFFFFHFLFFLKSWYMQFMIATSKVD